MEAHLYRAATLLRLNKADDAAWEVEEVKSIEPDFSLNVWSNAYPMARGKQLDLLLSDLRKAGFLEGLARGRRLLVRSTISGWISAGIRPFVGIVEPFRSQAPVMSQSEIHRGCGWRRRRI